MPTLCQRMKSMLGVRRMTMRGRMSDFLKRMAFAAPVQPRDDLSRVTRIAENSEVEDADARASPRTL